jgi:hypothetical protein
MEDLKNLQNVQQMFFWGATGDEKVIQVGENEWQVAKYLVHETLATELHWSDQTA